VSVHSIRYDGVENPATPDIISHVYFNLVEYVQRPERPLFAQRLDDLDGGCVILMFGLGVGLTFKTTTALALQLLGHDQGTDQA
jgi:hypothetical protein